MSFAATFHVGSDTCIRVLRGPCLVDDRASIVVVSEGLTILANCWEDMQRLVLALHDGIAEARQADDDAAHATFDSDDPGAATAMRKADADSTWAWNPRVVDQTGQDTPRQDGAAQDPAGQSLREVVAAADDELLEAGGLRVRLQREAREQLRAEGVPLCRTTVILRACALLHAQRHGDDLRTAPDDRRHDADAARHTGDGTSDRAGRADGASGGDGPGGTGMRCAAKRARVADLLRVETRIARSNDRAV